MQRLLCLLSLLLFTAPAFCASPSILVTVSDFTLDYSAPNRVVRLSPTAATGGVAQRGLSDSNGQATFTGVAPGLWTLTIESVGVPTLTLRVPSSSATLSASALVVSQWTPPVATALAASKAVVTASDKSITSSATTATELGYVSGVTSALQTQIDAKQSGSANLTSWSSMATSAKQDTLAATSPITASNATLNGWLKLQGRTNQIGDNGSGLTYNGTAVGGGGDTVWTNDGNYTHLVDVSGQHFAFGPSAIPASAATQIYGYGDGYGVSTILTDSDSVFAYGRGVLSGSLLTNGCYDIFAYGPNALTGVNLTNSSTVFAYGDSALEHANLANSSDIYAFGNSAGDGMSGEFTHVFLIGSGSTATASGDWVAGDKDYNYKFPGTNSFAVSSKVAATAGFASTDTTAAVSIASTGWTNTFAKNAVVYYDGISVTAKVYDNAGTAIYTNATALGGGSILLQPSGKVILIGTSVVGRAAPF